MKKQIEVRLSDEQTEQVVKDMEKKIRSLETKVKNRDRAISRLQQGADLVSKERRKSVLQAAEMLVGELRDAGWIEVDAYYDF